MAVDTNFGSFFENLKLEDLWLRPRPWESVPSESGLSHLNSFSHPSLCRRLYDTLNVSEASLVRLVMNALQGVESALVSIEKLSAAFCSSPADRTFHRIPSLWNRSLSTLALGNILKAIGRSGCVVFLLLKFVDHFTNLNLDGNSRGNRQVSSEPEENRNDPDREEGEHPSYSLVNQAFAIAVGKVLEGYISALDTLYASVSLRRLSKTGNLSSCFSFGVGCLTSIDQSEVTLLEVYLHTKGLRTQIEALGNICHVHDVAPCFSLSTFEDLSIKAKFSKFPRGGDLLSYLYTQLKVSDPVHCGLLKFLFLRSCEPYCNFIRSWIYKAKVSDPYNEFIVDHVDNLLPYSVGNTGISIDFPSATVRERDGVAIPCFLKDILIPLFRAGQQLQVLMKLLELSDNVGTWNRTYEDLLPYWGGLSSNSISHASPLTFNKGGIETVIRARNIYYKRMMEKLENLLINLDFRYQQVVPHGFLPVFVNNRGRSLNMTTSFAMDDRLISPETDKKDQNSPKVSVNSEASSITDEFSYLEDPLESDECASLNSSEEQNQSEQLLELPYDMVGLEQKYVSALIFSSSISTDNSLQKPSKSDMSCAVESDSCEILEKKDRQDYYVHRHYSGTNLNDNSLPLELGDPNLSLMSETQDPDNQQDMGWLPRGLHKNNFYADRGNKDYTWLHISGCGLKVSNRNSGVLEEGTSYCNNLNISKNDLADEATKKYQCPSETFASSNLFSSNSWKVKYPYNFLSKNPMLTKASFVHLKSKTGESCSSEYREHQSSFDFTSVKDPFMVCVERLAASPRHQIATELSILTDSAASAAFDMSGSHDSKSYNCENVSVDKTKSSHMYSPLGSMANHTENVLLTNVSGGSGWESLLGSSGNTANITARDHKTSLAAILEIPLDFVIEKCLLEEILLQYKYVSKLTIKLLEEGFNLQEHFLALRRYHFMELADWADLFIMSLWRHKWYIKEADSRISEIQGFLELSVQRSSCERDDNKDRLYVYMKKNSMMPLSASATGIHSFDFLGLGYRVDWPLSIVLTPAALKIYAEIFSFLIQVKLAISSLAEAWCSLKELIHVSNRTRHPELHKSEVSHLSILMKLRQRVNHFVATLQQYVQSQLSHVSWFQFLHSLKHQVKDMMDLESVHMSYLTDSLHICFLSGETRLIASIVQSILQCALDFRSCVNGSTWETELDGGSHSKRSRINISQVLTIKGAFDKNIKELYLCYLKSPRHGEFGLSGFWDYLNYNEYYSEIIGKEMGHRALSV